MTHQYKKLPVTMKMWMQMVCLQQKIGNYCHGWKVGLERFQWSGVAGKRFETDIGEEKTQGWSRDKKRRSSILQMLLKFEIWR